MGLDSPTKTFYSGYDVDALTYKYGRVSDRRDMAQVGGVKTIGVYLHSVVAGSKVFASVSVGDIVEFVVAQVLTRRTVATKVSDDQISTNTTIELGDGISAWYHRKVEVGTTDTDGWHNAEAARPSGLAVKIDINNVGGATTNLMFSIEVRARGEVEKGDQFIEKTYLVATGPVSEIVPITVPCSSVRVGIKADSSAGGAATDVDCELIVDSRR